MFCKVITILLTMRDSAMYDCTILILSYAAYYIIHVFLCPKIQILSSLNHRNVIRFFGEVVHGPSHCIVIGWCVYLLP